MIAGITIAEEVATLIVEIVKMHQAAGTINFTQLETDIKPILALVEQYWTRHHPAAIAPTVTQAPDAPKSPSDMANARP
jgi:hypothetical protein